MPPIVKIESAAYPSCFHCSVSCDDIDEYEDGDTFVVIVVLVGMDEEVSDDVLLSPTVSKPNSFCSNGV